MKFEKKIKKLSSLAIIPRTGHHKHYFYVIVSSYNQLPLLNGVKTTIMVPSSSNTASQKKIPNNFLVISFNFLVRENYSEFFQTTHLHRTGHHYRFLTIFYKSGQKF